MLVADALTTTDRLADYMGITAPTGGQLTAMQTLINAITAFVKSYTSRTFKQAIYVNLELTTERGQVINLPYYPIDLTQPFTLQRRNSQLNEDQWETIDSLYYTVDAKAGLLQCMDGVYFFRTQNGYRASFTAGYAYDNVTTFLGDTEAGDVETAALLIAQDTWKMRGMAGSIYQERLGDYSITFQRPVKGATGFMFENPIAQAILDKYVDISPLTVLTPLQSI